MATDPAAIAIPPPPIPPPPFPLPPLCPVPDEFFPEHAPTAKANEKRATPSARDHRRNLVGSVDVAL